MRRSRSKSVGALRLAAAAACLCWSAEAAVAQYSQPLFLEAARDPGRAEVPSTSRSLALGGALTVSGLADDALASPANLVLAQGTDLVIAGGALLYAREELAVTPRQLPPVDPTRTASPRSTTSLGSIAIATRRPQWALAGFVDNTARYRHEFETAQAELRFATVQGVGFFHRGRGRASAATSVVRAGGAFAFAPWTGRLGIGGAVYGARLDYHVSANSDVESWSNTFTDLTFRHRSTIFESDRVDFGGWGPGFVVSGVVKPVRSVALAGRWRHEPRFAAVRELAIREVLVTGEPIPRSGVERNVQFRLPGTYALTGVVSNRGTVLVTELARANYSEVFEPSSEIGAPRGCDTLETIFCPGWAFGTHRTADASTWRVGIEQSLPLRRAVLRLRGGLALEQGYTLARTATDPSRTGGAFPAPPIVTEHEPPREDHTWLSFGAAYAVGRFEIAVGFGRTEHHSRLLTDFRMRID